MPPSPRFPKNFDLSLPWSCHLFWIIILSLNASFFLPHKLLGQWWIHSYPKLIFFLDSWDSCFFVLRGSRDTAQSPLPLACTLTQLRDVFFCFVATTPAKIISSLICMMADLLSPRELSMPWHMYPLRKLHCKTDKEVSAGARESTFNPCLLGIALSCSESW